MSDCLQSSREPLHRRWAISLPHPFLRCNKEDEDDKGPPPYPKVHPAPIVNCFCQNDLSVGTQKLVWDKTLGWAWPASLLHPWIRRCNEEDEDDESQTHPRVISGSDCQLLSAKQVISQCTKNQFEIQLEGCVPIPTARSSESLLHRETECTRIYT